MSQLRQIVEEFRDYIEEERPGPLQRNAAGIQVYRDGHAYLKEHTELDPTAHCEADIVSLTAGATRKIVIRERKKSKTDNRAPTKRERALFHLEHGDVFIMGGIRFQNDFTYELPMEKQVSAGRAAVVLRARKTPDETPQ